MLVKQIKIFNLFLTILNIVFMESLSAQYKNIQIDYFGQQPPGNTPTVFSPDFISREGWFVQNCCFSQDGKEFVFVKTDGNWSYANLMHTQYLNGQWTEPTVLFPELNFYTPFISYNDSVMFLIVAGSQGGDVYSSIKKDGQWLDPIKMDFPISSNDYEWEVSVSSKGTLYFSSTRPGGYSLEDVYSAELVDGKYLIKNLGPEINGTSRDECPYIAPDESFMILNSWKAAKYGGNNLYVSFKNPVGTWSYPILLDINTNDLDIYPYVTPDGKYLMYTVRRPAGANATSSKLYWMKLDFFDSLKQTSD